VTGVHQLYRIGRPRSGYNQRPKMSVRPILVEINPTVMHLEILDHLFFSFLLRCNSSCCFYKASSLSTLARLACAGRCWVLAEFRLVGVEINGGTHASFSHPRRAAAVWRKKKRSVEAEHAVVGASSGRYASRRRQRAFKRELCCTHWPYVWSRLVGYLLACRR
jgi:hypothetical protein